MRQRRTDESRRRSARPESAIRMVLEGLPGPALVQIGRSRGGSGGWGEAGLESRRQDHPGGGRSRRRVEQAEELPSLHVVFNGAILKRDARRWGRGNESQLLGCGFEEKAQELGVGRTGPGHAPLPATDQVAGNADLPLTDIDPDFNEPSDHVLLRPTTNPPQASQYFASLDFNNLN